MKKIKLCALIAAVLTTLIATAEPIFDLDFTAGKKNKQGHLMFSGKTGAYKNMYFNVKPQHHKPGQLICTAPAFIRSFVSSLMRFPEATVEVKFKLNSFPQKNQYFALFTYHEAHWGCQMTGFYITPGKSLRYLFNGTWEKPVKKKIITTAALPLLIGKEHTAKFTFDSSKVLRIYLDGKMVLEEQNVPGFADFTAKPGKYFPYTTIGSSVERNKPEYHLDGVITRFAIHNNITSETTGKISDTDVNVVMRRTATPVKIDGVLDEAIYKNAEWSRRFSVLGKERSDLYGAWIAADDKFQINSSSAAIHYDNKNIYVAIKSPFPQDTPAKGTAKNFGSGDCVEFFLQPDNKSIYQIFAGCNGGFSVYKYDLKTLTRLDWQPVGVKSAGRINANDFTVEMVLPFAAMGIKAPASGTMWRGNFARSGNSCGGLSTWAPVGTIFLAPKGFGKFIVDSRRDFLKKELAIVQQEIAAAKLKSIPADLTEAIGKFSSVLNSAGNAAENWDNNCNALASLRNRAIKAVNAGKSFLVWQNDYWNDFAPDVQIPFGTTELTTLRLRSPRGARAISAFLVSNLTPNNAMFSIVPDVKNKKFAPEKIRLRQVEYIELNGGRFIPDPIFDLPLGGMLRVPANTTAVVWVDVDTAGFKPGKYKTSLQITGSYKNFGRRKLALELNVSKVDISSVKFQSWAYPLRWPRDIARMKDYGFNTACLIPPQITPVPGKDGKYTLPQVDSVVEAFRKNGIADKDMFFLLYVEWPRWSGIKLANGKSVRFMEPGWAEAYAERFRKFRDYMKEKYNISYDQYAVYTNDEPNGDPDKPKTGAYYAITGAKFVRSVDPKIQLFANPWRSEKEYLHHYFKYFDILTPALGHLKPDTLKMYQQSGKKIGSYTVLFKSSMPVIYRSMHWKHLQNGFEFWATFYDLHDHAVDPFNSYDRKGRSFQDYQTVYRLYTDGPQIPSRRLEAWYLGTVEFRLARFCRDAIANARKKGINMDAEAAQLARIIAAANAPGASQDEAGNALLDLAEKLQK